MPPNATSFGWNAPDGGIMAAQPQAVAQPQAAIQPQAAALVHCQEDQFSVGGCEFHDMASSANEGCVFCKRVDPENTARFTVGITIQEQYGGEGIQPLQTVRCHALAHLTVCVDCKFRHHAVMSSCAQTHCINGGGEFIDRRWLVSNIEDAVARITAESRR